MSVTMLARAFDYAVEHGLAPPRRLVLYVMADAADDDGRLWPGQKRLRRLTGLSVSTIRQALREFEDAGILHTQARVRDEGRGRTSNLYTLDLHAPSLGDRSGEQPPPPGDSSDDQPPHGGEAPHREAADQPPRGGGPIDGGTVREPSGGTDGVGAGPVFVALERVAFARRQPSPNPEVITDVCATYADRDLPAEAEAFAHYWIDGPGATRSLRDVGWAWRGWLQRAKAPGITGGGGRGSVSEDLKRLEAEAHRLRAEEAAAS